jgi:hypothetical protein
MLQHTPGRAALIVSTRTCNTDSSTHPPVSTSKSAESFGCYMYRHSNAGEKSSRLDED